MGMSSILKERTIEEWRELGFYYNYDSDKKRWELTGSKSGLMKFCDALRMYSLNQNNNKLGEHDHLGPYMYLKVATSDVSEINENGIYGTLDDLMRLSQIVGRIVQSSQSNCKFIIDKEYSDNNEADIVFALENDGFDPSSLDTQLTEG